MKVRLCLVQQGVNSEKLSVVWPSEVIHCKTNFSFVFPSLVVYRCRAVFQVFHL